MTHDHQRIAEALAELKAAANGTPMQDRLIHWLTHPDVEGDPGELLRLACAEAHYHYVCPQCGYQDNTVDDVVKEVQDAVLDRLLDEQQDSSQEVGEHP